MRQRVALLVAVVLVPACGAGGTRVRESSEVVALVVRTEPPGAQVRVNRIEHAWMTPCDVADPAIHRGHLDVAISLEGFEPVARRVKWDGAMPARLDLTLVPLTGTIAVTGASPGSSILLVRTPASIKDVATVVRLWSENAETLKSALEALSEADAKLAQGRIRELEASALPGVAEAAKKKEMEAAGVGAEGVPNVVHRVTADAAGAARLAYVPPTWTVHLLVTRADSGDFLKTDLKPQPRATLTVAVGPAKPVEPPKPVEPAKPPEATSGPALGKLTVKAAGDRVRVTAGGKVVADVPTHPEESVKLTVPREKVLVEFIDAKSGAVTGSVELVPEAEPAPPPGDADRVGRIHLVHRQFGVFVKLDAGQELAIGDPIAIFRDGREVARAKVLRVCAGDAAYPAGAAMLSSEASAARKGDEARRAKP